MKKCAELIHERLEGRQEDLRVLLSNPDYYDYFNDPAIGIDEKELTTITLSWGGPADYIEVVHSGHEIETVTYRYSDWFDTASVSVHEGTPMYEYAQFKIEYLNERIG